MNKQTSFAPHRSLPGGMNREELADWLKRNAVEEFTDIRKIIYTEDQLVDFKEIATMDGREINRLKDLKKRVDLLLSKGNPSTIDLEIPETVGVKASEKSMREHLDMVEKGYEEHEVKIFGIPIAETERMEYFDKEGNIMEDRGRPLSAREIQKHIGMFARMRTVEEPPAQPEFKEVVIHPSKTSSVDDEPFM